MVVQSADGSLGPIRSEETGPRNSGITASESEVLRGESRNPGGDYPVLRSSNWSESLSAKSLGCMYYDGILSFVLNPLPAEKKANYKFGVTFWEKERRNSKVSSLFYLFSRYLFSLAVYRVRNRLAFRFFQMSPSPQEIEDVETLRCSSSPRS